MYVNVVPYGNCIKMFVGYRVKERAVEPNERYASIDLGINNLAVVASNVMEPYIINGKPLKSINQYSNKKIAYYKSLLAKKQYISKRIKRIYRKRNNKITDYLHKATAYIVNQLVSNNIKTLIIGYNKEWKQDTKMGKVNNQNFVGIPFYKFKSQLEYKCALVGIAVEEQEESYTSKCSFKDDEEIRKHSVYRGQRISRGLYRAADGSIINADLNGSLNIMKKWMEGKAVWNAEQRANLIEACSKPNVQKVTLAY